MSGVRLRFRYMGFGSTGYTPVMPGEPVFDPSTKRMGLGVGSNKAVWFPKATETGNLEFDLGQGLVSADGVYSLKFATYGLSWKVSGEEIFATRSTYGIAVKSAIMMRNASGADVVIMGYGHYIALMAMLRNIKALLRKLVLGTAVAGDVNALLTPSPSLDLTSLDPTFADASSL